MPEPFCHLFVAMPLQETERWVGYVDQVQDGVRPLIVHDEEADVLRLVSPVDPSVVLNEGPMPEGVTEAWETGWHIPLTADFDGDGVFDLVASGLIAGSLHHVALVDGGTFELIGELTLPFANLKPIGAIDVDADGAAELITLDAPDALIIDAWRPTGTGMELVQTVYSGPPATYPADIEVLLGDFDGDGRTDLTLVWGSDSEPYWAGETPQIYTILAPSSPGPGIAVTESPHPAWARSAAVADMNGDGDSELVIAAGPYEILVMDWDGAGFVESETLALPEGYTSSMDGVGAGKFVPPGLGGVLVGGVSEADVFDAQFNAAIFPEAVGAAAMLGFKGAASSHFAADFNADGIDDLRGRVSNADGLYLSSHNP